VKGERESSWIVDAVIQWRHTAETSVKRWIVCSRSWQSIKACQQENLNIKFITTSILIICKILWQWFYILQSICTRKCCASCINTRSILWCLFQKRSPMLSPILPFKNFSLLHSSSPSTKFSNLTNMLWKTHVCIGEISEISFFQLRGLNRRLLKMAAPIRSIFSEDDPWSRLVTRKTCGQRSTSVQDTPSASMLFFQTNLVHVLRINMHGRIRSRSVHNFGIRKKNAAAQCHLPIKKRVWPKILAAAQWRHHTNFAKLGKFFS